MPDNGRQKLFRYKYFERRVTTRRKYARKVQQEFLSGVRKNIDNDPNRSLHNNTVQYGQAHLESLKQQASYYSSLLKECITDLKKGQRRNGVAAVRYCFDRKHNNGDNDAMQLLKRNNGDTIIFTLNLNF